MKQSDRLLFLKYAAPCATTLVQRKKLSEKEFEEMILSLKKGIVPKGVPEKIFKVAFAMCSAMALRDGKKIDEKIIREYFWFGHDAVVDERFELMRDFDPVQCKTYPGVVAKISGKSAMVKTSFGEKEYFSVFAPQIKKGDFVVVHRGFVVEKVGKKTAEKIAKKTRKFYT
ncbi:MAG: HypC/HybG/HupF family hydrogenase formation chaperone [Candidatus Diapherotrites archaeon]|nr:HypC/HybG/HupF family hydrogenase formation chaperone [Candidatus Diapherotrites archaeon]